MTDLLLVSNSLPVQFTACHRPVHNPIVITPGQKAEQQ